MENKYEKIGDILEYGSITDEEAVKLCNQIICDSTLVLDDKLLESMFYAIFTGVNNRNIASELNLDCVINNIDKYNDEILDYIITILAYTGDEQYLSILSRIGETKENLDVNEAIEELKYRAQKDK